MNMFPSFSAPWDTDNDKKEKKKISSNEKGPARSNGGDGGDPDERQPPQGQKQKHQQKEREKLQYDLRRYQNRAALTEAVLKEKVDELALTERKLTVLEDVVRKLKAKNEKTRQSDVTAAKDLEARYKEEMRLRRETIEKFEVVRREWDAERSEFEKKIGNYETQVGEIRRELEEERRERRLNATAEEELLLRQKKEDEAAEAAAAAYETRIKALQNEMLELDELLEKSQQQVSDRERELREERDEYQKQLQTQQSKVATLVRERDDALNQLKEEKQKVVSPAAFEESMEIAKASVAASERRESELRSQVERLAEENAILKTNLTAFRSELESLKKRKAETLENRQRQYEELLNKTSNMKDIESLEQEVRGLNEQIRALKLSHAAQLRGERKTARDELAEVEREYEERLARLSVSQIKDGEGSNSSSGSARSRTTTRQAVRKSARKLWERLKRPFRNASQPREN